MRTKMKFLMNIWRRRRIFAQMLLVAMMISYATPAMAAETEVSQQAPIPVEVDYENRVIKINWEDMVTVEEAEAAGVGIEPYSTKIDFVNKAGVTSTDLSFPFTVPTVSCPNVYFILTCSYLDGTTGSLPCTIANYTGTAIIDGKTRTMLSGVTLYAGVWEVKIEKIKKPMSYTVKVYAFTS